MGHPETPEGPWQECRPQYSSLLSPVQTREEALEQASAQFQTGLGQSQTGHEAWVW